MAKMVGLSGTISGRIGNVVYSKFEGLTIGRSYQPQVRNPRTERQIAAREKFEAATKFVSSWTAFLRLVGRRNYDAIGSLLNSSSMTYNTSREKYEVDETFALEAMGVRGIIESPVAPSPLPGTLPSSLQFALLYDDAAVAANKKFMSEGDFLGGIVVVRAPDINRVLIAQGDVVDSNIVVQFPQSWSGLSVEMHMVGVIIPKSGTRIATTATPWKYIKYTSPAIYLGHREIE